MHSRGGGGSGGSGAPTPARDRSLDTAACLHRANAATTCGATCCGPARSRRGLRRRRRPQLRRLRRRPSPHGWWAPRPGSSRRPPPAPGPPPQPRPRPRMLPARPPRRRLPPSAPPWLPPAPALRAPGGRRRTPRGPVGRIRGSPRQRRAPSPAFAAPGRMPSRSAEHPPTPSWQLLQTAGPPRKHPHWPFVLRSQHPTSQSPLAQQRHPQPWPPPVGSRWNPGSPHGGRGPCRLARGP
mmetsp:Transcript_81351/g.206658  ORF Transcript_81351/g.206658 Transcript_81351/m.206658 type:complete len:239 (+) Transcript_81351:40-756(+)